MGIPRLRHHLLPFSQTVLLQKSCDPDQEDVACVHAVVIDGPSLVYHVYSRLLSWFSVSTSGSCMMDALPTCDEVSRGVMLYLLHLRILGVEIQAIYFDGSLPARKHETRVARLESQRRKLELFCSATGHGFVTSYSPNRHRTVTCENVLRSRPSPAKYSNIPTNPFMVPTVYEDLKCRWSSQNMATATGKDLPMHSLNAGVFPWASVTIMVPGEADAYCARTASLTGCNVLTNDSDLVLYDLGDLSSVIILDSVELNRWDPNQPLQFQIRATGLRPSLVARRLGISNLLSLAYQLKLQPEIGPVELLRRTKAAPEMAGCPNYQRFIEEYRNNCGCVQAQPFETLDTRISELFWQYKLWGEYVGRDSPQVYLPVLSEDHGKRCAWTKGRLFRSVAYSILNLAHPISERHRCVTEFTRRGRRIAQDRILLGDENWISAQMEPLCRRLESVQTKLGPGGGSPEFWRIFGLFESYGADAEFTRCDFQKLKQFLIRGYMGQQLEWADIHLAAQIQAILYSLRVLKQLLQFSNSNNMVLMKLRGILEGLPPLHLLMGSRCRGGGLYASESSVTQLSHILGHFMKRNRLRTPEDPSGKADPEFSLPPRRNPTTKQQTNNNSIPARTQSSNMYEILQEQ
ncbi:XPG domain containing-domain-containing protein [Aspergillus lucknowensis]|uniref:XPG domain containing-domain-containing protein n=1 Tax=Aspergillus lucknowensis TaxID=176173 RepID=A0ABR4LQG9_9EURO